MNQDTCCQFVSVVWLKDGLRPDATSMLAPAKEDKETKHADSAFCSAIFPSCSPVQLDAGQLEVKQWMVGTEALNHNSSLEHPLELVNHYSRFRPRVRERGSEMKAKITLTSLG